MSDYTDREATCLWHELRWVYPDLAPPDERTPEERQQDAEQAKDDLFGPENKKRTKCRSRA